MTADTRWLDETLCRPLGLSPDAAALQRLVDYAGMLVRWNATYNLTAVRTADGIRRQHLADCLAVVGPVARELQRQPAPVPACRQRVLDVGSGGGLPGVVLAILLPQAEVWCIDAVAKKAAFVRQVAAELDLPTLHAVHGRVEQWQAPPFDLITCRAWTTLADFTQLTRPLLAPSGVWMAMKAREVERERATLPGDVDVFHVEPLNVPTLEGERCLVWMKPHPGDGAQPPPALP